MVGPINPAGQPGVQPDVSKATAKPQPESPKIASTPAPTDTVNVPAVSEIAGAEVPATLDDARATAKKASSQLSGQSLNIANVRTQGLTALFRAA